MKKSVKRYTTSICPQRNEYSTIKRVSGDTKRNNGKTLKETLENIVELYEKILRETLKGLLIKFLI